MSWGRATSVALRVELGAVFGGTIVRGQCRLGSLSLKLISPPNGVGGLGRNRPSTVVVASGDFGLSVTCWAIDTIAIEENAAHRVAAHSTNSFGLMLMIVEFDV